MFPEGRVFDFLIVGVIALIVVGPKDLPILMRKVGQALGKMRALAAEFRASFDELARQSELEDLRREVEAMRVSQQAALAQFNPLGAGDAVMSDIKQSLAPAAGTEPPAPVRSEPPPPTQLAPPPPQLQAAEPPKIADDPA